MLPPEPVVPDVPPVALSLPPPVADTRGVDMRGQAQRFGDRIVRAWKGSKRPPDIDPTIWNHFMSQKAKREAIKDYEDKLERERAELAAEEAARAPGTGSMSAAPPTAHEAPPPPGFEPDPPPDAVAGKPPTACPGVEVDL